MKRLFTVVLLACIALAGCERYEPITYHVNKSPELERYEAEEAAAASAQAAETSGNGAGDSKHEAGEETQTVSAVLQNEKRPAGVQVKGIYLTAQTAGSSRMDEIIEQIERTELNAVVIDVKSDDGRVAFAMDDAPLVSELGAVSVRIEDAAALVKRLHAHGIYVIARCPAFRDLYLAKKRPEWALKQADGSVFQDSQGMAWLNPYQKQVWDYLMEIGTSCANAGFDEVQFDYVRFCTEQAAEQIVFDEALANGRSRLDVISEFAEYASKTLAPKGVYVSADVFGSVIGSYVDASAVGQDYAELASRVDYVCPMIYPSHYADGYFGIAHPDTEPYQTVLRALKRSREALEAAFSRKEKAQKGSHQAGVRPWLQGFTASYLENHIEYTANELREQIRAVKDSGYNEWIIWNASNRYPWEAFEAQAR